MDCGALTPGDSVRLAPVRSSEACRAPKHQRTVSPRTKCGLSSNTMAPIASGFLV